MLWNAETGVLNFQAKFKNCEEFFPSWKSQTVPSGLKHLILKLYPTVYDPLGLNSPFTGKAGLILQDLSKVKDLNWDMKIPDRFAERWSDWQVKTSRNGLRFPLSLIQIFFKDRNLCLLNAYVCITESVTDETAMEVNGGKRVVAVSLVTSKAWSNPTKNWKHF